ncbi:putative Complement C1q tumor necrosis factor-related protein 2 [Daphnia magna]|uniref:Uncharacterized protein n=2 Tax=Daphnia magna TaxID=35525 RepID=A0ABR0ADZ0_9CRUS|nr:hypothetical protein OUZ56_008680 [Daphnia magna]KZS15808.1 putative Complement C1q tumor necrosis factor-related protein 2 [Daphnia magna]
MFPYSPFILALIALSCRADQVKPNGETVARRSATTTRPIRVDKIRDVEAIDPGLLSPPSTKNVTLTRSVTNTLGKQFSNPLGQGGSFGNSFGSNSFGGTGSNLNPDNGFQFTPGVGQADKSFYPGGQAAGFGQPGQVGIFGQPGQVGTFGQPGQVGTFGQPGQVGTFGQPGPVGGFPNNGGVFPGGGVVPGSTQLPPGSVAADSVAFSAARASDFTRVGVTQVRFDFTLTDVGYGWYPDRSEFVCYYPGLYFFTFHGLSSQTRQFKLSLVKNNQEVISAWGDTNGYQSGSNTAILALNQGDRVYLVLQEGNLHETNNGGRGYTTFSGFRIR